jgi:hypothetical protein
MKHFITFFAFIVVTLYLILSMLIKGADLFQWDLSGYGWFWEVYITIQTMMFWLIVLPGLLFSAAVFARFMFVCYSGVFLVWEDTIEVLRTALNPPDACPV